MKNIGLRIQFQHFEANFSIGGELSSSVCPFAHAHDSIFRLSHQLALLFEHYSTVPKYIPSSFRAMHRASIDATSALISGGN